MMANQLFDNKNAVLILTGASEWPKIDNFQSSQAFSNSAKLISDYFKSSMEIADIRVLDLFDSPLSSVVQLSQIKSFLNSSHKNCKDVFFYYVGHGLFTENNDAYALAIRDTEEDKKAISSLPSFLLAKHLQENAKNKRLYIMVDACFSADIASTIRPTQSLSLSRDFEKGTLIFSSSSHSDVSKLEADGEYTQFTKALVATLQKEHPTCERFISFNRLEELVNLEMEARYGKSMTKAELNVPDRNSGDISLVDIFPNKKEINNSHCEIICGSEFNCEHFNAFKSEKKFDLIFSNLVRDKHEIVTQSQIDKIISLKVSKIALFSGPPGVGKSMVSSALFHYIKEKCGHVIYIDLMSFEKDLATGRSTQEKCISMISSILSGTKLNAHLIIDGMDFLNPLGKRLAKLIREKQRSSHHIFWFARNYQTFFKLKDTLQNLGVEPAYTFSVGYNKGYSKLSEDEAFINLVAEIFSISPKNAVIYQTLLEKWVFENRNNLRLFSLILHYYDEVSQFTTAEEFFKHFFNDYVQRNTDVESQQITEQSCQFAFYLLIQSLWDEANTPAQYLQKRIATQSVEMLGFLSARYICSTILQLGDTKGLSSDTPMLEKMKYVYPHLINKYAKSIILSNEDKYFEAIRRIYPHCCINFQAFLSYLLGRFKNDNLKAKAKGFLTRQKRNDKFAALNTTLRSCSSINKEQKELLVLHRTVFISLIYLGGSPEEKEYIQLIESNPHMDTINRGFHLAYYGDSNYFNDMDMLSDDAGLPFINTLHRIKENIEEKSNKSAVNLFVYTLVSLSFCRLQEKKLEDSIEQAELTKLCEQFKHKSDVSDKNKRILDTLTEVLRKKLPPMSYQLVCMYELKEKKRNGWANGPTGTTRYVLSPENVSSHVDGAVRLAVSYLPERDYVLKLIEDPEVDLDDSYKGYDKYQIIKLLTQHDIGEWKHGDIPQHNATKESKLKEKRAVYQLVHCSNSNNSIYLANTHHTIFRLWQEYIEQSTVNAKIAKDIDKLECLIQLYIYQAKAENNISDFKQFEENLRYGNLNSDDGDGMKTKFGAEILEKLIDPLKSMVDECSQVPTTTS